jgi:predicted secreted protein
MLNKVIKPCIVGLSMLVAMSALAVDTDQLVAPGHSIKTHVILKHSIKTHVIPGHSIKTHLIQPPVLMPGPVLPTNTGTVTAQLPKRGIGPVAVVSRMKRTVSKDHAGISVMLPVNKTTGAHWEMLSSNDDLIQVLGHKYLGPVSEVFGAPGHEVFNFKALPGELNAPRTTHIVFALVAADGHIIQVENVTVTSTGA